MANNEDVRFAAKINKTLEDGASLVAAAEAMREQNRPLLEFVNRETLRLTGSDPRASFIERAAPGKKGRLSRIVARRGRI